MVDRKRQGFTYVETKSTDLINVKLLYFLNEPEGRKLETIGFNWLVTYETKYSVPLGTVT